MIDLTEQFFTEIYPKYRDISSTIDNDKILRDPLFGNCAVLSVRGKDNVRILSKLISSNGLKPTILEFEEVLRSKGRVHKKLKNINLLISHAKDTPVHLFSGSENYHYERFLGKNGILIRTKFSNYKITPEELMKVLFFYIETTGALKKYFYPSENVKTLKTLAFPIDIKETSEYKELLDNYKFEIGFTDIRPVPNVADKTFWSYFKKNKSNETNQLIKFTFVSNIKIDKKHFKTLEAELDKIFAKYERYDLKSSVQTVYEGKLLVGAA